MSNVTRLENEAKRMLRTMSSSRGISFGNDAPYRLGRVGFARIGFADQAAVGCRAHFRDRDYSAMIPVVRQHILRAVEDAGLDVSAMGLRLHVGFESRERMFEDANESSATRGKNKRGKVARCHLEVERRDAVPAFRETLQTIYL